MRETAALQRKKYPEEHAERLLVGALRGRGGTLTKADASALTGLSADETEQGLKRLLGRYRSHLAVTEQGELLYTFDRKLERRDAVPLRERLAAAGRAVWRGFKAFFKVMIAVTLVVYVIAFVVMALTLIFARTASDRDDRRDDRGGGGFGFPWLIWWMMPDWGPAAGRYRQPRAKPRKRFYKAVFDYVFGPPKPAGDELADEREVVSFIRSLDGRVTATDLVALTGWSYPRAEEELTRLLADYDGEPEVADNGSVVYSFPSLRQTAGESVEAPWRYTWQEQRRLEPLTGNTGGTNTLITIFNGFNLFSGLTIGPMFLQRTGVDTALAHGLVTYFPLAFSSLFFAIPIARWLQQRWQAKRLAWADTRAGLLRAIFAAEGAPREPVKLLAAARPTTSELARTNSAAPSAGAGGKKPLAGKVLDGLLVDLEGDVAADDAGEMRYAFPRLGEELVAGRAARREALASERTPGEVVFSSKDDLSKPPRQLK